MNLKLSNLLVSRKKGIPIFFRIFLPPNIKYTAPKNIIMVKIDIFIKGEWVSPESLDMKKSYILRNPHLMIAILLEHWGEGRIYGMMQITAEKLSILLYFFKHTAYIFWPYYSKAPLLWENNDLPIISDFLNMKNILKNIEKTIILLKSSSKMEMPMQLEGSLSYLEIKLPSKNYIHYNELLFLIKNNNFTFNLLNKKWILHDKKNVLNFLACYLKKLKNFFKIDFSKNFSKQIQNIRFAKIICYMQSKGNDFSIKMLFKDNCVTNHELLEMYQKNQFFLEKSNDIILFDPNLIKKYIDIQKELNGDINVILSANFFQVFKKSELIYVYELIEKVTLHIHASKYLKEQVFLLKNIHTIQAAPISFFLNQKLRNYQKIGISWMFHLYKNNLGGILADEMGLGKTVQAIGFIECVLNKLTKNTCLIICPAILVENWKREINFFSKNLTCFVNHGLFRLHSAQDISNYDIILTSYSTIIRDYSIFSSYYFSVIILDEAQNIKNQQSLNFKTISKLKSKGRFLLTGTPLENKLEDLESLFAFIIPDLLEKPKSFFKRNDRMLYYNSLKNKIRKYILRRSKKEVLPELPHKFERVVYCEMDSSQYKLYQYFLEKSKQDLLFLETVNCNNKKINFTIFQSLLRLRQICAEPRILNNKLTSNDSTKLKALKEIILEAINGNHKILIFSQFVSVLKYLQQEIEIMNIPYCYLDGKTRNRQQICDQFNNDPDILIFFISLKTGGIGLNLTSADIVIHYDPWWNPAIEKQATDRTHRIGQTKIVNSIKLIVKGSIEEKVLEMQKSKLELLNNIFLEGEASSSKLDIQEIKKILQM